jgi:hypothetical protein
MYSYLAKVQQMHPQMQIPQSASQKKQEAERRQKELEQQKWDAQQQQQQQQQQRQEGGEQYRYDYHQVTDPLHLTWIKLMLLGYHKVCGTSTRIQTGGSQLRR